MFQVIHRRKNMKQTLMVIVLSCICYGARKETMAFSLGKKAMKNMPSFSVTTSLAMTQNSCMENDNQEKKNNSNNKGQSKMKENSNNRKSNSADATARKSPVPISRRRTGPSRKFPYKTNPYNIPREPEMRWEFYYVHLLQFYLEHGHTNVQVGVKVNESMLRNWMAEQRRSYMITLGILPQPNTSEKVLSLTLEKKIKLDQAGFDWGQFGDISKAQQLQQQKNLERIQGTTLQLKMLRFHHTQDSKWTPMFQKLLQFYQTNGHTNVPAIYPENPALGKWTYKQRLANPKMPLRRKEALNELQFHWMTEKKEKKAVKVLWTRYLSRLKKFQMLHGHCNVPADYYSIPNIAVWVVKQRKFYKLWKAGKRSPMNDKRVDALESIGFEWTVEESIEV